MRSHHRMPFGAEVLREGGVRFRLWAPAAKSVDLMLYDGDDPPIPMLAQESGWFEVITEVARTGSRYRYRIDGTDAVPDPASRFNSHDVDGPSVVIDPESFGWTDEKWRGRPWHEAVVYEMHIGTFTPEGTFAAAEQRLDMLVELGITAIELMPIADFPGKRGWGYDGVLQFAPDSAYGSPTELKWLMAGAHRRGLSVLLDVVYNHFGPEGNWLHRYAPQFFTDRHHTPWGSAINLDGDASRVVRDFYIHNALYWLEEYHFDGLRFDAIHAIKDDSKPHLVTELANAVHDGPGRERHIHLVLENGDNQACYLGAPGARDTHDAQWNDDVHHCLHVILTGETDGYYTDYAERPHAMLCRCLAEGFGYQGEPSRHEGHVRGQPSAHLPPTAFVSFLQNHDQIGNRAFGERLSTLVSNEDALRAAVAVVLLAPSPPLIFMGEEWAAPEPFVYFCDFGPELGGKVRDGRKREFARFKKFAGETLPDPTLEGTFRSAKLDWSKRNEPQHAGWLDYYRRLLAIRARDIVPRIPDVRSGRCIKLEDNGGFAVDWQLGKDSVLHLLANLTDHVVPLVGRAAGRAAGRVIFATHPNIRGAVTRNELQPWSVTWLLERHETAG